MPLCTPLNEDKIHVMDAVDVFPLKVSLSDRRRGMMPLCTTLDEDQTACDVYASMSFTSW